MAADSNFQSRNSNYPTMLAITYEPNFHPPSPGPSRRAPQSQSQSQDAFPAEAMAEGYFKTFFLEERRLGMGTNGPVFLCQHILDGNPQGHFAVKKIAVGNSRSYLLNILREVRLLERLRHPNIVTYHHAWLETLQFSSFGPKVPTLHILMQWAEGGNLDDFINTNPFALLDSSPPLPNPPSPSPHPAVPIPSHPLNAEDHSRSALIRTFRVFQKALPTEKDRMRRKMEVQQGQWTAAQPLSAEEVKSIFTDVVEGLVYLHGNSILHLALKPENVLLTWDEEGLTPRAMLSDIGTSHNMVSISHIESGNTRTTEYDSPESLPSPETGLLQPIDSKADMWSLGMILHNLLFFKLPYKYTAESDADETADAGSSDINKATKMQRLEQEMLEYPGFKSTSALVTSFESRRLPLTFLVLLESLLNKVPGERPSAERVSMTIREGSFDPLRQASPSPDATISELEEEGRTDALADSFLEQPAAHAPEAKQRVSSIQADDETSSTSDYSTRATNVPADDFFNYEIDPDIMPPHPMATKNVPGTKHPQMSTQEGKRRKKEALPNKGNDESCLDVHLDGAGSDDRAQPISAGRNQIREFTLPNDGHSSISGSDESQLYAGRRGKAQSKRRSVKERRALDGIGNPRKMWLWCF